jgi:hypothetical protein
VIMGEVSGIDNGYAYSLHCACGSERSRPSHVLQRSVGCCERQAHALGVHIRLGRGVDHIDEDG